MKTEMLEIIDNLALRQELTKAINPYYPIITLGIMLSIIHVDNLVEIEIISASDVTYYLSVDIKNNLTTSKSLGPSKEQNYEDIEIMDNQVLPNSKLYNSLVKIFNKHAPNKEKPKYNSDTDLNIPFIKIGCIVLGTIIILGIINAVISKD